MFRFGAELKFEVEFKAYREPSSLNVSESERSTHI